MAHVLTESYMRVALTVDRTIPDTFGRVLEQIAVLIVRFCAIVFYAPNFSSLFVPITLCRFTIACLSVIFSALLAEQPWVARAPGSQARRLKGPRFRCFSVQQHRRRLRYWYRC